MNQSGVWELQESFMCIADSRHMVRFFSLGQGQHVLFCLHSSMTSLISRCTSLSFGTPQALLFSSSHSPTHSLFSRSKVLLLIPCPRPVISRTILAFYVDVLAFLSLSFFFLIPISFLTSMRYVVMHIEKELFYPLSWAFVPKAQLRTVAQIKVLSPYLIAVCYLPVSAQNDGNGQQYCPGAETNFVHPVL